jgi:hypothetical protein
MITQLELKERYTYVDGSLINRKGVVVGNPSDEGYLRLNILGRTYAVHRLVWLYMYGNFPDGEIDHINGNPLDNRIENLRACTRRQNEYNKGLRKDNTTGVKGVHKYGRRYRARIRYIDGSKISLGVYDTLREAAIAYNAAALVLQKEYARLNTVDQVDYE